MSCGATSRRSSAGEIQVQIDVPPAADQMVADPDRIEQVVENLFANGLRHTPDGGTMALAATINEDAVALSVADSGEGIPPDHVPHVFERFYKVDSSRANGSGGSGLGLSISRAIVERHGGTLAVASRPGQTVFTITLPRASAADERPTPNDHGRHVRTKRCTWFRL